MPLLAAALLLATGPLPTAQDVLARVAQEASRRHGVSYSGTRTYFMRNYRFNKQAKVVVHMTYRPGQGKHFTTVERSGADRLGGIIQNIIDTEVEASQPNQHRRHGFTPSNYDVRLAGSATINGRECWTLILKPRDKSKLLIAGTIWVDKYAYEIVRLDGNTAASLSIWVGSPHIVEDRAPAVGGLWLPTHTHSHSSAFLTGDSDLDISYTSYQLLR